MYPTHLVRVSSFGLALAGLTACGNPNESETQTQGSISTTSTSATSEHHDHTHNHDHDHKSSGASSQAGEGETDAVFDPSQVGIAPPDPGPIDCSSLKPTGIEVGDTAPSFTLLNGRGDSIRLHDYCNHVIFLISGTMSCSH